MGSNFVCPRRQQVAVGTADRALPGKWPRRQQAEPGTARQVAVGNAVLLWGNHIPLSSREESRGSDLWPRDSHGLRGSKWNRALPGKWPTRQQAEPGTARQVAPAAASGCRHCRPGTARMGQQILSSMVCCSSISMTSRPSFSRRFMMSLKRLKPIWRSSKSGYSA